MTQNDKLKRRILLLPKDFTFEELESLLFQLGFKRDNKGKLQDRGLGFTIKKSIYSI